MSVSLETHSSKDEKDKRFNSYNIKKNAQNKILHERRHESENGGQMSSTQVTEIISEAVAH